MQIANLLANFSLGKPTFCAAQWARRKKRRWRRQRAKFMSGCRANKIPEKKAERIFNLMEEFAGYGFNKSHSCAYALLAYQTAYLKTHYPVEFMAHFSLRKQGIPRRVVKYINEARGMSVSILPPDVNESDLYFTPVGEAIRFGLAAIKKRCENTAKAIRILAGATVNSGPHTIFASESNLDSEQASVRKPYPIRRKDSLGPRERNAGLRR